MTRALAAALIVALLAACSHPTRFDPGRQELQRRQDQCLARGGSPPECRP